MAYDAAYHTLSQSGKTCHIEYLQEIKTNRYRYSKYILDKVKGSMCKHGSAHSEQNHSIILARIGDMCYELHVFIYNLMDRQKNWI